MTRYNHSLHLPTRPAPAWILFIFLLVLAISTPQANVLSQDIPEEILPEVVPGRVIVKLIDQPEPSSGIRTASIDTAAHILAREEILSVAKLYTEPAAFPELARQAGLEQVYLLDLQEGVDVFLAAEALAADPNVEYAEPDYMLKTAVIPNDTSFNQQWGLNNTGQAISYGTVSSAGKPDADIDLPEAWDISRGSRDIIIAVIDTGVDLNHPDLASKLVPGHNFISPGSPPQDDGGHGTHVAGIVAGGTNNSTGVAGVCWECRIMPLKALSTNSGSTSTVVAAINYAVNQGAHVINLSLGGPAGTITLHNAVKYAYLAKVPIVAAMMNEGKTNPGQSYYPAAYPETIAVGSTDKMDLRSDFSSYGNHIDLSAPGSEILSTYWVSPNQHAYAYLWGTSMASPHIAGVIGLLRSINSGLSVEEIRSIVRTSADDLGTAGWDIYYGAGRVNAYRALQLASHAITGLSISGPIFLKTGQEASFTAGVSPSSAQIPITYSWVTSGQTLRTATTNTLSNLATYTWSTSGIKMIKVTVANEVSTQVAIKTVYVGSPIFLPSVRNKK